MLVRLPSSPLFLIVKLTYILDEKSWIKEFFESVISSTNAANKLSCAQTNQYFFPSSGSCNHNIMQSVWDALASNTNLDFIMMSQYINGQGKGRFFDGQLKYVGDPNWKITLDPAKWQWGSSNGGTLPESARDALYRFLAQFQASLTGVLELKSNEMQALIKKTNSRIYAQL